MICRWSFSKVEQYLAICGCHNFLTSVYIHNVCTKYTYGQSIYWEYFLERAYTLRTFWYFMTGKKRDSSYILETFLGIILYPIYTLEFKNIFFKIVFKDVMSFSIYINSIIISKLVIIIHIW